MQVYQNTITNLKLILNNEGMSQNGRPLCHLHGAPDDSNLVFCHAIGGDYAELTLTGSPDDYRFVRDLLALKESGYRFAMTTGGEHTPPLDSPSDYTRTGLTKLGLPMALPD